MNLIPWGDASLRGIFSFEPLLFRGDFSIFLGFEKSVQKIGKRGEAPSFFIALKGLEIHRFLLLLHDF